MADMAAADTAGVADMVATVAAAFIVVTPVDFMDAVPTSLAVATGADTKGTAEPMGVMVATAERATRAKMTTTDVPAKRTLAANIGERLYPRLVISVVVVPLQRFARHLSSSTSHLPVQPACASAEAARLRFPVPLS